MSSLYFFGIRSCIIFFKIGLHQSTDLYGLTPDIQGVVVTKFTPPPPPTHKWNIKYSLCVTFLSAMIIIYSLITDITDEIVKRKM